MPKTGKNNDFVALQRKQLDAKLRPVVDLRTLSAPRGGWIKTIRTSLGMSTAQLAKRLGMTSQGALDLERRERDETIGLKKLREAAEALNMTLVVVLVPSTSLEAIVQERAHKKALDERNRIVHTMRLEDQHGGVEDALDVEKSRQDWLTKRLSALWD